MNNDDITDALEMTGKLMELHGENPFKTRAYANAAYKLSKLRYDFEGKSAEDVKHIEGIGKGISDKIVELMTAGTTKELSDLLERTPPGVVEMLSIKGLGPKKVRQLWQELNVESAGELLYACNENRLITLKGFGERTQLQVLQNIEFNLANANKFHYATIEKAVNTLVEALKTQHPGLQVAVTAALARKVEVIEEVTLLVDKTIATGGDTEKKVPLPVRYTVCAPDEFYYRLVELTSTPAHLEQAGFDDLKTRSFNDEAGVYKALGLQYIEPELREGLGEVALAEQSRIPALIETKDLRGILHNHTTYSDGVHTLKEMADYCKQLGYDYLGICDHSKTAVYAQGLSIDRVMTQQAEIDALNKGYKDFKILKGIESDILHDGDLDYPDEVLKTFDFVVASVHSGLKMDEQRATTRLIKAIENPFTSILGHPTGRLLLGRKGYPIDHRKVIDACAANGVCMELNANPYRLDIDWRWIPYCLEKGVLISINPDAHHKEGYHDMYYGVCVARKGMLDRVNCLNAMPLGDVQKIFSKKL